MTQTDGLDVLVVGAGFGRDFLHLYASHPQVRAVGLCEPDAARRAEVVAAYGVDDGGPTLEEALASGRWDVVHLCSPVRFHVEQTLAVLASGRSCGSAVPMATTLEDVARVIDAASSAVGRYMMMETSLYQREYLHALHLRDSGAFGRLTYLRGDHMQDLDGFPPYWMGYPPMQYATHIVAPLLGLAQARVTDVTCQGSGTLLPQHRGSGDNPFPLETALMRLEGTEPLVAQVTMSFFSNARSYTEGFDVYGDMGALEWPSIEGRAPVVYRAAPQDGAHRGRPIERIEEEVPDRAEQLPPSLARWTRPGLYAPPGGPPEIEVHAWHGGSHPHLVHELVSAVAEDRPSAIDEHRAATITAPGIVAHASAMRGGERLAVPAY